MPRKPKKSQTASDVSLSATNFLDSKDVDATDVIPKAEQVNINHLFLQALARHKHEQALDKKQKIKEISHLGLMAEEYLSSFILIGYSLQNEKVIISNMPSPKDEAALVDLLRATFIDIATNRP